MVAASARLVACGAALLVTARAGAAGESVPIELRYDVHTDCPDSDEFQRRIQRRMPNVVLAQEGRRFDLLVRRVGDRSVATLGVDGDPQASRRISAATCDAVLDLLAFVIAVAIDPESHSPNSPAPVPPATAPPATAPPATAPPATAPPATAPPGPRSTALPSAASQHDLPPESPPPTPVAPSVLRDPRSPTPLDSGASPSEDDSDRLWSLGFGASFEGATGVAPAFTPAGRLGLALALYTDTWVEPVLRLSASRGVEQRISVDAQRGGTLTWTAGRLEICAARPLANRALRLGACGGAEFGALRGEGIGVTPIRSDTRPWVALPLLARLSWAPSRLFAVEAYGGAIFPLMRDEFVVRSPRTSVYEVPVVAATAGLGASVFLP